MNANKRENIGDLLFKDEVYKIVGAAYNVANILGCGFLEAVYQEALEIEFRYNQIPFESQKRMTITYRDKVLDKEYISDFVCFDKIIVEIKRLKKLLKLMRPNFSIILKQLSCRLVC